MQEAAKTASGSQAPNEGLALGQGRVVDQSVPQGLRPRIKGYSVHAKLPDHKIRVACRVHHQPEVSPETHDVLEDLPRKSMAEGDLQIPVGAEQLPQERGERVQPDGNMAPDG